MRTCIPSLFFLFLTLFVSPQSYAQVAPGAVVINEIDYDDSGPDDLSFIELKNLSVSSVALDELEILGFNGASSSEYFTYRLGSAVLAPGARWVLGVNADSTTRVSMGTINEIINATGASQLQNGPPDGFYLRRFADQVVIDSVSYEGPGAHPPGATDSGNAGEDPASDAISLSRYPDGADTNDNSVDFTPSLPSPGEANNGPPIPSPVLNVTSIDFGRFNHETQAPATVSVALTNLGVGSLQVTTFTLTSSSAPQFSITTPPTPSLPATLGYNQSVILQVTFSNSDLSADRVFTGVLEYVTDAAQAPTGIVPLRAEFVRVLQSGSQGQVRVNELCYNPLPDGFSEPRDYNRDEQTDEIQDEFIEIYNTGVTTVTLQGWELRTLNTSGGTTSFIFPPHSRISPLAWMVVFGGGAPSGFLPGVSFTGGPSLANSGAWVMLRDGTSQIDDIAYSAAEEAGRTNSGVLSAGGSIGRIVDASPTWVEFPAFAPLPENLPSPGLSNGTNNNNARDWIFFQ